jgi:2-iminobutanoate/2-iminopropanoate deaminase
VNQYASRGIRSLAAWLGLCSLTAVFFSPARAGEQKPAAQAGGPFYSPSIQVGDTLYLSGQVNIDPKTGELIQGIEPGTRQAMLNLKKELESKRFSLADVVATHVWLTDVSKISEMNAAYRSFFQDKDLPTRTTVGVPALAKNSSVEIAMVAVRGKKEPVYPGGVERGKAPFSPGMLAGDTLYLSGQAGVDPSTGKLVQGDFSSHVTQTLKNIEKVLEAGGMGFANVVSAEVYLTDVNNFEAMNKVYHSYVKDPRPARVPVGVSTLPLNSPVEITMIASRKKGKAILPEAMPPSDNYSRGLLVGDTMYLAGVFSREGTTRDQVRDCIGRMERILKAGGLTLNDVAEARVYLADMKDYDAMNEAYKGYFAGRLPTRATVASPSLPGQNKLGMSFVAAKTVP